MKVKSESEVAHSCPTLCNPVDCSLPGSSIHGILQARVLEWSAIAVSARYLGLQRINLYLGLPLATTEKKFPSCGKGREKKIFFNLTNSFLHSIRIC